ncbi:Protein of unknown function [Klenkia soli]|uniref:DUF2442 domain-containing protein n=1 Tax=Klenkia soli TaxID=1052260 RepID=A0A1H0IT15_9ACTN|nr:DUF2442 domain-containing protein [Klenkia soli]SDO34577.1 Protein of unknown function [Klenkia soli]
MTAPHDTPHGAPLDAPDAPSEGASAGTEEFVDVVTATPLDGYRVRLGWADGLVSTVDCEPFLLGEVGEPVRDPAVFAAVQVDPDAGTLVWTATGLDISPVALRRAGHLQPAGQDPTDPDPLAGSAG